jgi:NTE family protein
MLFNRNRNRKLNLALQGGGAHGAFTWGVLDALLEDGRTEFDGVSGTSAGAMNAVVLAQGWMTGGRDGARAALSAFWAAVSKSVPFETTVASAAGQHVTLAPAMKLLLRFANHFAPEQINPLDFNPLRNIVSEQVDFERLRRESPVKLFVAATHANTGKLRIFRNAEMSVDSVMASACLPAMHRAVEIDGEPYWDGGYSANPAVFPLFHECATPDILLVLLAPLEYGALPNTADGIKARMLEVAFNSNFLREMRMFAHLNEVAHHSPFPLGRFERRVLRTKFHVVEAHEQMSELTVETKLAASKHFLERLRDLGRERAKAWLNAHYAQIGNRSTVELADVFC